MFLVIFISLLECYNFIGIYSLMYVIYLYGVKSLINIRNIYKFFILGLIYFFIWGCKLCLVINGIEFVYIGILWFFL